MRTCALHGVLSVLPTAAELAGRQQPGHQHGATLPAELDLLNTWITPVGSASFAIPGGCPTGEYLGQRLLES